MSAHQGIPELFVAAAAAVETEPATDVISCGGISSFSVKHQPYSCAVDRETNKIMMKNESAA